MVMILIMTMLGMTRCEEYERKRVIAILACLRLFVMMVIMTV